MLFSFCSPGNRIVFLVFLEGLLFPIFSKDVTGNRRDVNLSATLSYNNYLKDKSLFPTATFKEKARICLISANTLQHMEARLPAKHSNLSELFSRRFF